MEKQMYIEYRGSVVYLVVRGNKQLNSVERHNLKKWGFIPQDSARRVYAVGFNREESAADRYIGPLRRFGFVLTENVPVCALTDDGTPYEIAHPADKHLRNRESSFSARKNAAAVMNASLYSASVTIAVPAADAKVCPAMADEEAARYSRMIENSFRLTY